MMIVKFLGIVASLLLLTSCIGVFTQWGDETSLSWKSSTFDFQSLEGKRIAILDAAVGMGLEGYRHQVSQSLFRALTKEKHPFHLISPQETKSQLNREGLAKTVSGMAFDYSQSGILDRGTLNLMADTLGCHYVIQPGMAEFRQTLDTRLRFFGLRVFQTRITNLRLSFQLWDTRSGEIVWESSGEGTMAGEDVRDILIPFGDITQTLWSDILSDFGHLPDIS
ncbi:MAG: hypothetical protein V3T42_11075 [Nitrospirales bacterium]